VLSVNAEIVPDKQYKTNLNLMVKKTIHPLNGKSISIDGKFFFNDNNYKFLFKDNLGYYVIAAMIK
jgi:hypothetical protein